MATSDNDPHHTPSKRRRKPSRVVMALGFVMAGLGTCLFFLTYSNNPGMNNFAIVLGVAGAITFVASAFRRDRRDHANGNSNT